MCRNSVHCVPNRGPGRKSIDLNRSLAGRNSIVYGPNPNPNPNPNHKQSKSVRHIGRTSDKLWVVRPISVMHPLSALSVQFVGCPYRMSDGRPRAGLETIEFRTGVQRVLL